MEKNKTGKYFKYAIGEIVLVVIGILIALQINNFNESRKDRINEQVVLKQLKEDYQANLLQLEQKMKMRSGIIKSAYKIFEAMDMPNTIIRDSLIKNIATINDDPTFDPIQNDLINSGNIRLITNEKLKRQLSNWTSDVIALQEIEVIWSNKNNQQLDPVIAKLRISRDVSNSYMSNPDQLWMIDSTFNYSNTQIGNSKYGAPINEIITDYELEGLVTNAFGYNQSANIQSQILVKRINDIIELIDIEIVDK